MRLAPVLEQQAVLDCVDGEPVICISLNWKDHKSGQFSLAISYARS